MGAVQKKKMLYIMDIDWDWIYQRPQAIAEHLSKDYDVTVAYPVKFWNRYKQEKQRDEAQSIRKIKLWAVPFQRKNRIAGWISEWYRKLQLRNYQKYEYIYIDYPIGIEYISEKYRGCLIYDCIDDYEQMCTNEHLRKRIARDEEVLIQRSDIVIVSSRKLLQKKSQICNSRLHLVRNGTGLAKVYDVKENVVKEQHNIGYIGTIADWFDYSLIERSTQSQTDLRYHLIGPNLTLNQTKNSRIIYEGIVEHAHLKLYVKDYDCMVMPFVVNEIVKAVDPVKLYEYIAYGKCIVSVYYEELEYFKDYVYFYRTEEEYNALLDNLINHGFPPKYNSQQQEEFLEKNSWDERYRVIHRLIEEVSWQKGFSVETGDHLSLKEERGV